MRATASFLREHLAEPITFEDAADHVGYSPAHLARTFTRHVGVAPGAYLAATRFHAAKTLLLEQELDVVDACTAVGYTSLPTFTRRFSAAVGITPGRLRPLAQSLADSEQAPFAVTDSHRASVVVTWDLPAKPLRRPPLVWLGWYPSPAPLGLPRAGRLVSGTDQVKLPLCVGAPWLLAFAVDPLADVTEHLAPSAPLVAVHPAPLRADAPSGAPAPVHLDFSVPGVERPPLLSALPVLRPEALRRIG